MLYLPASKSIGARYLVATFFAGTLPADPVFQDCEDLRVLQDALLNIYADEEPIDYGETPLDCHSSGTAMRFLTAVCASVPGADFVVTGTPRLLKRPMAPLLDVLRKAGASVVIQGSEGTGPYRITGARLQGGTFDIPADISSQFISALMLASPTWAEGIDLKFTTPLRSKPYLEMTAKVMERFKIRTELTETGVRVFPSRYEDPDDFRVEADWSAATFFYEAELLGAPPVVLDALRSPELSMQGDSHTAELFSKLGVESDFLEQGVGIRLTSRDSADSIPRLKDSPKERIFETDLSQYPDMMPALAAGCAGAGIHFRLTGVGNLRLKESDRLEAMRRELAKLGYLCRIDNDTFEWRGELAAPALQPIDPHDDHRIAMAFAMLALRHPGISILNPDCVEKSFLNFWNQLPEIGISVAFNPDNTLVKLN